MKTIRTAQLLIALVAGASLALSQSTSAANISMSGSDGTTEASFAAGTNWTGGAAPTAGNDYFTGANTLRTTTLSGSNTFAGDSLTVQTGGSLWIEANDDNVSVTINNLILSGGQLIWDREADRNIDINGGITLDAGTTSTITTRDLRFRKRITVNAPMTGSGDLIVNMRRFTDFTGNNTNTGDMSFVFVANETEVRLTSTGSFLFDIGDGSNNQVNGDAQLFLDGRLNLDVADVTTSGSWTIVDVPGFNSVTYGGTFDIGLNGGSSFVDGGGVWTLSNAAGDWSYTESTGVLDFTAVPEPGSLALLGLGGLLVARRRR